MKTYYSSSNYQPVEWDIISSKTTVYHNYDVIKSTDIDGDLLYNYTVDEYTRKEYNEMSGITNYDYNLYNETQVKINRVMRRVLVVSADTPQDYTQTNEITTVDGDTTTVYNLEGLYKTTESNGMYRYWLVITDSQKIITKKDDELWGIINALLGVDE